MRLRCDFSTPVARTDLDDYVRHLEIGVACYDEDGLDESAKDEGEHGPGLHLVNRAATRRVR